MGVSVQVCLGFGVDSVYGGGSSMFELVFGVDSAYGGGSSMFKLVFGVDSVYGRGMLNCEVEMNDC